MNFSVGKFVVEPLDFESRHRKLHPSVRPLMASGGSTPYTTAEAMGEGPQNRSLRRSLPQHRQLQSGWCVLWIRFAIESSRGR